MQNKTKSAIFYFILLQPFLDLYWFYNGKLAELLPFTLPTIIRIMACGAIFLLFFSQKSNWQKLGQDKWLITYLVLLVVYSLLHLWHVSHFNSLSASNYGYSTSGEIFYLIRMILPLMLLYFTQALEFSKNTFKLAIQLLSALFSATIVLSNLLVISLRSYGEGRISASILQWFTSSYGYSHLASKGFFNFSNMVSAVLFMLLPLLVYYLLTNFNWQNLLFVCVLALAMIELGTKVALAGLIGGILIMLVAFLIHRYFLHDFNGKYRKPLISLLAIEAVALALTPASPAVQRYQYEKFLASQSDHNLTAENDELALGLKKYPSGPKREAFLRSFIKENYQAYALNEKFVLKSYPYQEDPEFWLTIMRQPGDVRLQNRYLEIAMLNRVRAHNNNRLDYFLGIAYTRESNIFNLERDFLSQIYSVGWLGMLLLVGPYLLCLIYGIWQWFCFKAKRNFLTSSLILAESFMLAAAFFSGNVMDFLTASFILAFVEGFLFSQLKNKTRL